MCLQFHWEHLELLPRGDAHIFAILNCDLEGSAVERFTYICAVKRMDHGRELGAFTFLVSGLSLG